MAEDSWTLRVSVVQRADGTYDVVLVAVRRDQLATACAALAQLGGRPAIVLFGNNPAGHSGVPADIPGRCLPWVPRHRGRAGRRNGQLCTDPAAAHCPPAGIRPSPRGTGVGAGGPRLRRAAGQGHDGWLAYHAAFVACIAAALYRSGTDPLRLSADRKTLTLICRAITQSFAALHASGTGGLSRNLSVLHSRFLTAVAVRYWARTMGSPRGELWFAATTPLRGGDESARA